MAGCAASCTSIRARSTPSTWSPRPGWPSRRRWTSSGAWPGCWRPSRLAGAGRYRLRKAREAIMKVRATVALAALFALSASASGQVPPQIAERVRAEGKTINRALDPYYAPQFGPGAWQGVRIERDLAYGADARHRLDVYLEDRGGRR